MKTARNCADMKEEQVCELMGINKKELISWETGNNIPTAEQAIRLSEVYGLPIDVISFQKEDNKVVFDNGNLLNRIKLFYESNERFAKAIGMKPDILEKKLSAMSEFTRDEIVSMRRKLLIKDNEVQGMFFCEKTDPVEIVTRLFPLLTKDEFETLREIVNHGRPGSPAVDAQT